MADPMNERHQIESPGRILDGLKTGALRLRVRSACPSWHARQGRCNTMTTRTNKFLPRDTGRTIEERQLLRQEQAAYRRRFDGLAQPQRTTITDLGHNYADTNWIKP